MILIHGWPLSSDTWDDQAMALATAGYRAIAYDRRGFGRSTQPWSGYDYDTLADDLAAAIEQTGAKDAVIVGFSSASNCWNGPAACRCKPAWRPRWPAPGHSPQPISAPSWPPSRCPRVDSTKTIHPLTD